MPGEKPRVQPLHVPLLRPDPLPPSLGQAGGQHRRGEHCWGDSIAAGHRWQTVLLQLGQVVLGSAGTRH